jgi:beta-phosphoglucomutase-like phosphatase (HAD superfamily)
MTRTPEQIAAKAAANRRYAEKHGDELRERKREADRRRREKVRRERAAKAAPPLPNVTPAIAAMTASTRERCACGLAWADHRSVRHSRGG